MCDVDEPYLFISYRCRNDEVVNARIASFVQEFVQRYGDLTLSSSGSSHNYYRNFYYRGTVDARKRGTVELKQNLMNEKAALEFDAVYVAFDDNDTL
jgi:hypothetical protein